MSRRHWLLQYTSGTLPSLLSDQSKKWLLTIARVKLEIESAVLDVSQEIVIKNQWSATEGEHDNNQRFWGREDEYQRWSKRIKDHRSVIQPIPTDEAWLFVLDNSGLWVWRNICGYFSRFSVFETQKLYSSPFAHLGMQLLDAASNVNINELSILSATIDAINLQLSTLGSFGDLYHRVMSKDGVTRQTVWFAWHHDLQPRINSALRDAQKSGFKRSPSQHHQDNIVLQPVIWVFLLVTIYPLYRALNASAASGTQSDPDFWSQITNTTLQLAGFLTLLLPIYRETAAKEWVGTWILTILGCLSAIIAIPLYLSVHTSWSAFFSWMASSTQLLVVLQVALVAAFRDGEHAKQD